MSGIRRIFIANCGEIAIRVIRTARALGIETVLGVSEAGRDSLGAQPATRTVRLGPAPASESYLKVDTVAQAAKGTGCDAIHPGYGFLSENRSLAETCAKQGLIFVGPSPENLAAVGGKLTARAHAEAASVPLVPGGTVNDADDARAGDTGLVSSGAGSQGRHSYPARRDDPTLLRFDDRQADRLGPNPGRGD